MADTRSKMTDSAARNQRGYIGFDKLKGQLGQRPGVQNPGALTAYIGRKKHGKRRFQRAAARGAKLGRR